MADFLLTVGVDVGLSYTQMQNDITILVSELNANPPRIKLGAVLDQTAIDNFRTQIANIQSSTSGLGVVSVGAGAAANVTQVADAARNAAAAVSRLNTEMSGGAVAEQNIAQGSKVYYDSLKRVNTLLTQVVNSQNKWTAAKNGKSSAAYNDLNVYANDLRALEQDIQRGSITVTEFKRRLAEISSGVTTAGTTIKAAGEATLSWSDRLGSLAAKFGTWFNLTRVIMLAYRAVRQMVTNVIELDTAMTELKKVTDETDATYEKFLVDATSRAKQLGATLKDTVSASSDFARLGYSIGDSEKLADAAIVYKNVGDGIENIDEASESVIATMQAFGIAASDVMSIVDKFNNVGNNYAISSGGVGDALLRSAAAMHAANNTLDETIALATAANTVVNIVPRHYGNIAA